MIFSALLIAEITKAIAVIYGCRLCSAENKSHTQSNLAFYPASVGRRTAAGSFAAWV